MIMEFVMRLSLRWSVTVIQLFLHFVKLLGFLKHLNIWTLVGLELEHRTWKGDVLSDIYCLCTVLPCMHYWFVLSLKVTVFITTVSFVTSFLSDHVYIEPERVSCILCKRFISTWIREVAKPIAIPQSYSIMNSFVIGSEAIPDGLQEELNF